MRGGVDYQGRPQFSLHWGAVSNANYRIQHRASLAPGGSWKTIDVFRSSPEGGQQAYVLPQFETSAAFFRLQLPEPEVFSIEPARFPLGGPVELFVIGQGFDTNNAVRAGQLMLMNEETIHPGLRRGNFVPPSAGVYTFELVQGSTVLSSFAVECFDPASPPPWVLQEPPEEPWASPGVPEMIALDELMGRHKIKEDGMNSGAHKLKEQGSPRVTASGEMELDRGGYVHSGSWTGFRVGPQVPLAQRDEHRAGQPLGFLLQRLCSAGRRGHGSP